MSGPTRTGSPRQQRFPVEALRSVLLSQTNMELARTCHMDRRQLGRYIREGGFPTFTADRLAGLIGMHPSEVWPEWFEEAS